MKLSEFIRTHLDEILEHWEAAARRRAPVDVAESVAALRDNGGSILEAIARRLDVSEDGGGNGSIATDSSNASGLQAAGEAHGADRAEQGFTLKQMISEYPTLRSTVVQLWQASGAPPNEVNLRDLERFHAAVDMALTESVTEFMDQSNRAKEMFIGILGHDLRDPLSTILMSAKLMRDLPPGDAKRPDLLEGVVRAGERMNRMVSDLLDFTRSRLGKGIPVSPHPIDLRDVVRAAANEATGANPEREVRIEANGDLHGEWDDHRIGQAVGNLLGNAVQHGAPNTPVEIVVHGDDQEVSIEVHNEGPPIPEDRQRRIFEPLAIGDRQSGHGRDPNHLGLGLYITNEIARRHGGRVDVSSSAEKGTTFTMHLPRAAKEEA